MQPDVNLWLWLTPYVLFILLMVYAMMEFTVSLLVRRPTKLRTPLAMDQLRSRILALEPDDPSFADLESSANTIVFHWKSSTETKEGLVRARTSINDRLYLFLDEERTELCICESGSSSFYFFGLQRWIPRISAFAGYSAGPPGMSPLVERIAKVTLTAGWSFRPVILPYQASEQGVRLLRGLTPPPLRRRSPMLVWGILYPLSYGVAIGWLFAFGGPEMHSPQSLVILLLCSVIWWGVWALLAWAVCGLPQFWRRKG